MIVHPYNTTLAVFPKTRLLKETFGLVGATIVEPAKGAKWTIHGFYAPIPARALGGIRARVLLNNGMVSFVNQRDLEVLLGDERPGAQCRWATGAYAHPEEKDWCGFCVDADDGYDDLLERELFIRGMNQGLIPDSATIQRTLYSAPDQQIRQNFMAKANRPNTCDISGLDERWLRLYATPTSYAAR